MTVSPEGSCIGLVYVVIVGHRGPKHSYEPPRHHILVHRQDLEGETSWQGDVVVVAFGSGGEFWKEDRLRSSIQMGLRRVLLTWWLVSRGDAAMGVGRHLLN